MLVADCSQEQSRQQTQHSTAQGRTFSCQLTIALLQSVSFLSDLKPQPPKPASTLQNTLSLPLTPSMCCRACCTRVT